MKKTRDTFKYQNFFKKRKILLSVLFISASIIAVMSFYFGAYSFYHKLFPFSKATTTVTQKSEYLYTAYNDIEKKSYNTPGYSKYGSIAFLNDKLIYMQGDGQQIFLFDGENSNFEFKNIKAEKLPIGRDEFIKKHEKIHGTARLKNFFGLRDIMISKFKSFNTTSIFVSSLDYDIDNDCYRISIFRNEFVVADKTKLKKWKKIFSTKQCLTEDTNYQKLFYLSGSGGRIVKYDENNILLSTGNFDGDGFYSSYIYSQDSSNDYGKIIKINLKESTSEIFTTGHRNPQGLFLVDKDYILSTEHGPKGGDEMNLIKQGKNYGWPFATFGTDYGSKSTKTDKTKNSHNGYEKPIFSWGNQFAASQLIVYKSDYLDKWKGNIITSSLAGRRLIRMVFDQERKSIVYTENIPIGKRIRDIVEAPNGKIALLTDQMGVDGFKEVPEIIFLEKKLNNK